LSCILIIVTSDLLPEGKDKLLEYEHRVLKEISGLRRGEKGGGGGHRGSNITWSLRAASRNVSIIKTKKLTTGQILNSGGAM